ncbi:MAG: protein-L-isoaspartate(D-aspartate) O-methyltransferase [Candidatus Aminicenantales bacterium]
MEEDWDARRERMVTDQIINRGVKDEKVIRAMRRIPRHLFVPREMVEYAYNDEPVAIGEGQTISQPYIVAYMTEVLNLSENDRVLEIGTGSGYQTAVLAEIAKEVYTVEIIPSLSLKAKELLANLGYSNVFFKIGDGTYGWVEKAPYEAIIVTAAPATFPRHLEEQLKTGGRMVIPVGETFQELYLIRREKTGLKKQKLLPVRFVPLITVH